MEQVRRIEEDNYLPLSGLQHMVFCDRQAALIHVEGVWIENALTVEGGHLHRVVDDGGGGLRQGVRVHRGLRISSQELGLSGRADVVEFHPASEGELGVRLDGDDGLWRPFPVEYKRGRPKSHRADEVQLCAQAICLEEHFDVPIREGALFYGKTRRRTPVLFSPDLRAHTAEIARSFHEIVRSGQTPVRAREPKCRHCSLLKACLPPKGNAPRSAAEHTRRMIRLELDLPGEAV